MLMSLAIKMNTTICRNAVKRKDQIKKTNKQMHCTVLSKLLVTIKSLIAWHIRFYSA